ncbi:hypothetical protein [Sphingomonas yantingensis]|uniref:Uncharacterized protein n=1 Tax=Sphingomonas yantingensis TaxID=1241761 RepID=A0A7W9AT18_9SPHN|nr:hypothetical protein [Sphingomonas yantingensis]MBB5700029.1 hypothetical protein [Sphingomonas yantingensis]
MIAFFIALYIAWGTIGALVAINYGAIAHTTWREQGGSWRTALGEWLAVPRWLIACTLRDIACMATFRALPDDAPPPIHYDAGHMLRFFVSMSFICSAVFGFVFWTVDRGDWPTWLLVVNATAVITAMVAGLGHLFLAWRRSPRLWRFTTLGAVAFVATATIIGG